MVVRSPLLASTLLAGGVLELIPGGGVGSTVWRSALRFSFLWSSSWQFGCVKVDWVQRLWIGFSWAVDLLGSLMVFSPEADVPNQSPYPIWVSG